MAVSVPGLAISEMSSSSCLPLSTTYLTPRTSRPPLRVAASLRGSRVLLLNTRSTLPMVTTSPSLKIADPTRVPLTNVPLTLRSRISVPSGVNASVACSREAKTSGMTMSFSAARPIVTVPTVLGSPAVLGERCDKNLTILVARFDTSPPVGSTTVNSAESAEPAESGRAGDPVLVLTTVSSSAGAARDGTHRGGGWASALRGCETGCRGGAGFVGSWRGGGGARLGPLRAGLPVWRSPCGGGGAGSAFTDQETVGGPETRIDLGRDGRLVCPCCGPIAKVSRGPRGFPTLML